MPKFNNEYTFKLEAVEVIGKGERREITKKKLTSLLLLRKRLILIKI